MIFNHLFYLNMSTWDTPLNMLLIFHFSQNLKFQKKKQNPNLPKKVNYLHSLYILFEVVQCFVHCFSFLCKNIFCIILYISEAEVAKDKLKPVTVKKGMDKSVISV